MRTSATLVLMPGLAACGGGLDGPTELAIDGAGQIWAGNFHGNSLSELAPDGSALSPSTGYTGPGLAQPYGVAVDASGNVWVADYAGDSVTQFIGIAAPVRTPLVSTITQGFAP